MGNFITESIGRLLGWDNSLKSYYTAQKLGYTTPEWINTTDKWTLYNEIPELQAVINRYGKMIASANPVLIDKDGNTLERKVSNEWVFQLIDRPNAMQSWGNMMYMVAINKAVTNNALVYSPKLSFNRAQNLTPLAWNNVKVVATGNSLRQTDANGFIKEFQIPIDNAGKFDKFEPSEVIYICAPDGINLFSTVSKIDALKYPLSNIALNYKKRNVLLRNLFALGVLSGEKSDGVGQIPLDSKEKVELRNDLKKRHDGEIVVTDIPMKWEPMSFPTRDLMLFEEMTADKVAIIDAFGLNKHMFGDSENKGSTFSNVEMGEKQAYNSTIIPDCEIIYDEFTKQLGLDKQGIYLKADFSHISVLQSDKNKDAQALLSRSQALEKINASGIMLSEDEKRSILGI